MAARINPSKGGKPDKIMRDALSLELHREDEIEVEGKRQKIKRFRRVARTLVDRAIAGDTTSIKEINERMDGKVPQALVGDAESPPIRVENVTDEQRAKALAVFLAKHGGKLEI